MPDGSTLLTNPYIAAILAYLLLLTAVGVWKARSVRDSADFMVAGRSLHWFVLVGTLPVTRIAAVPSKRRHRREPGECPQPGHPLPEYWQEQQ